MLKARVADEAPPRDVVAVPGRCQSLEAADFENTLSEE